MGNGKRAGEGKDFLLIQSWKEGSIDADGIVKGGVMYHERMGTKGGCGGILSTATLHLSLAALGTAILLKKKKR